MTSIHFQHDLILGSPSPAQPFIYCGGKTIIKLDVPKVLWCNAIIDRVYLISQLLLTIYLIRTSNSHPESKLNKRRFSQPNLASRP